MSRGVVTNSSTESLCFEVSFSPSLSTFCPTVTCKPWTRGRTESREPGGGTLSSELVLCFTPSENLCTVLFCFAYRSDILVFFFRVTRPGHYELALNQLYLEITDN